MDLTWLFLIAVFDLYHFEYTRRYGFKCIPIGLMPKRLTPIGLRQEAQEGYVSWRPERYILVISISISQI